MNVNLQTMICQPADSYMNTQTNAIAVISNNMFGKLCPIHFLEESTSFHAKQLGWEYGLKPWWQKSNYYDPTVTYFCQYLCVVSDSGCVQTLFSTVSSLYCSPPDGHMNAFKGEVQ